MVVATVTVPVSYMVVFTLSLPPVKFALDALVGDKLGPDRVMAQPTPPHDIVSLSTQLLAKEVDIVSLLAALAKAVLVSVNVALPFGLLMVTAELAGKF